LPTPLPHDLVNTGKETLRAGAFFAAAVFIQQFDSVMFPPDAHLLGTPAEPPSPWRVLRAHHTICHNG
jgi:hypothetical protein